MIDAAQLPTIAAARVSLRWLTEQDVPCLFAIFSHPEVMRYWSSPPYADVAKAQQLLERIHACFAQKSLFQWGLVSNADGALLGTCTLAHLDAQNRRAELGYALGRPHWGQGYATEAGKALIDYGFTKLGIDRIINAISPDNIRSRNLMLRLGFTFLDNGNPGDMIGMLERTEWRSE